MNIFYLDKNHIRCAKYHCDKHVVKMILEYSQLLSSAHWMMGKKAKYKLTHKNHPCAIWVRKSKYNYEFLLKLLYELHIEYSKRYNRIHKSMEIFQELDEHRPELPNFPFSEPPQCMPEIYKNNDTVQAYRNYYLGEKIRFAKWKYTKIPHWISK